MTLLDEVAPCQCCVSEFILKTLGTKRPGDQKEIWIVFQGGDHSKKVSFIFKGIALHAGPSLRQVLLNNNEATVDTSGQFFDIEYQVRVLSRVRPWRAWWILNK